jgi:N-acetylneuraminate synthase
MFGPDAKASLTISEINKLVQGVNEITTDLLANANKESSEAFTDLKKIFQKSLAVNLETGHVITFDRVKNKLCINVMNLNCAGKNFHKKAAGF